MSRDNATRFPQVHHRNRALRSATTTVRRRAGALGYALAHAE